MRPIRLVVAAALVLSATALAAEEAADALNALFGDELRRVAATPSLLDDVALSLRLLRAARQSEEPPAVVAALCEKSYELAARDSSGYPTALTAMRVLAARVPSRKVESLLGVVVIQQRQYAAARGDERVKAAEVLVGSYREAADAQEAAGDLDGAVTSLRQAVTVAVNARLDAVKAAVQAQLTDLAARSQKMKQLAALKARLQADPKDVASRKELVRVHLVEMDDPAGAAAFVDETLDGPTRKYVPAAAKGIDVAPELACPELGDWYRGLLDQAATPAGKGAVLERARGYYGRFLALHAAEDAPRTLVAQNLKKVDEGLAALGKVARPRRLLVFTLMLTTRHNSTAVGVRTLQDAAQRTRAFEVAVSEDPKVFGAASLSKFDAVCLLNASGEFISDDASRKALADFVRGGKGLAAVHASLNAFRAWPEYVEILGAGYSGSPFTRASVKIDDPGSPLTASFGGRGFELQDELYSFGDPYSRDKVHVLLSVDVENIDRRAARRAGRRDDDYALSWIKTYGQGRVFCLNPGHENTVFTQPALAAHFLAGVRYALGDLKADATPSARLALKPARGPALN